MDVQRPIRPLPASLLKRGWHSLAYGLRICTLDRSCPLTLVWDKLAQPSRVGEQGRGARTACSIKVCTVGYARVWMIPGWGSDRRASQVVCPSLRRARTGNSQFAHFHSAYCPRSRWDRTVAGSACANKHLCGIAAAVAEHLCRIARLRRIPPSRTSHTFSCRRAWRDLLVLANCSRPVQHQEHSPPPFALPRPCPVLQITEQGVL